jgi:hypothetical protein
MEDHMGTGDGDANPFLSEEEDRLLGEIVRMAMRYPPSTSGKDECPAPETIRKIAFHEKVDRQSLGKALLHLPECRRCALLAERYVGEYRSEQARGTRGVH